MNDNRHEKAWNDPPLFSLDQMTRATNPTVISRRNRYPQQSSTNPPMNQMNNPMISTNPQTYGTNQMSNQSSYGQHSQQQNSVSNQMSFGRPLQEPNSVQNEPSYGQPLQQTNAVSNQSYEQSFQKTNQVMHSTDTVFDIRGFLYSVHSLISSANHLPQELVYEWQNIQNHIYGIPLESQTKVFLQTIYSSIQTKDFNSCRHYCNYLANDSNQTIRTFASILNQIFRYFP